jgi:hypothetical protein
MIKAIKAERTWGQEARLLPFADDIPAHFQVTFLTNTGLFRDQSQEFFDVLNGLAQDADAAQWPRE